MTSVVPIIVCTKYGTSLKYYEKHLVNHFSLTNGYALTKVYFCIKGSFLLSNTSHQKETDLVSFILRDCETGFVQDLIVYAGSSTMVDIENLEQ